MNKTTLAIVMLTMSAMAGSAATGRTTLRIERTDVASPTEIVVTNSTVVKLGGDPRSFSVASESIPLSVIKRIVVDTPNGVESVKDQSVSFRLRQNPVGDRLEIAGESDGSADLTVYSVDGSCRLAVSGWSGDAVDVTMLSPGMYILKINNQTLKFIKR